MDDQALAPSTFVNTSLSDPHPPLAEVNAREWIAIVFAWTLTPVDWIVTRCNVSEILAGNLSPSVQLGWHPIGAEGVPALLPLAEIGDSRIREGVRALLADSQSRFGAKKDWSDLQLAEVRALRLLNENRLLWVEYADAGKRAKALKEFQTFTWQWH
jgi:hypothetical protein